MLTLRRLGVAETPDTGAGVKTAGDGANIDTAGIEKLRCETKLALRAENCLGTVMAWRRLGMTADDETGVTCIDIKTVVLGAAIHTEGDGGQHHEYLGEGLTGCHCCHRPRVQLAHCRRRC